MDIESSFDKTLLKLNDLSLESMQFNQNEDIQIKDTINTYTAIRRAVLGENEPINKHMIVFIVYNG